MNKNYHVKEEDTLLLHLHCSQYVLFGRHSGPVSWFYGRPSDACPQEISWIESHGALCSKSSSVHYMHYRTQIPRKEKKLRLSWEKLSPSWVLTEILGKFGSLIRIELVKEKLSENRACMYIKIFRFQSFLVFRLFKLISF